MLGTLRAIKDKYITSLDSDFCKDLNWFRTFLSTFNGTTFYEHKPVGNLLEVDASLQGLGGRWGNLVYKILIPLGYVSYGIVQLEMLNVMVAIKLWSRFWKGKKITLECDNGAVVAILQHGKTRDPVLAAVARNIRMIAANWDVEVHVIHIPGVENRVADLLSRWSNTHDNQAKLSQLIPSPICVEPSASILEINWHI